MSGELDRASRRPRKRSCDSMTDSSSCARSNPARPLLGLLPRSLSIRRSAAATRSRARSRSVTALRQNPCHQVEGFLPRFIPPPSSGASKTSSRDRGVSARDVNLAALRRGTSRGTGRRLSPRPPRREGPRNILTEIGEWRGGACTTPAGALARRACAWRSVFVSR
jgi:hypothetical protein